MDEDSGELGVVAEHPVQPCVAEVSTRVEADGSSQIAGQVLYLDAHLERLRARAEILLEESVDVGELHAGADRSGLDVDPGAAARDPEAEHAARLVSADGLVELLASAKPADRQHDASELSGQLTRGVVLDLEEGAEAGDQDAQRASSATRARSSRAWITG